MHVELVGRYSKVREALVRALDAHQERYEAEDESFLKDFPGGEAAFHTTEVLQIKAMRPVLLRMVDAYRHMLPGERCEQAVRVVVELTECSVRCEVRHPMGELVD